MGRQVMQEKEYGKIDHEQHGTDGQNTLGAVLARAAGLMDTARRMAIRLAGIPVNKPGQSRYDAGGRDDRDLVSMNGIMPGHDKTRHKGDQTNPGQQGQDAE